jgi:hypothetical protein
MSRPARATSTAAIDATAAILAHGVRECQPLADPIRSRFEAAAKVLAEPL